MKMREMALAWKTGMQKGRKCTELAADGSQVNPVLLLENANPLVGLSAPCKKLKPEDQVGAEIKHRMKK
jgi:hypothetical protein